MTNQKNRKNQDYKGQALSADILVVVVVLLFGALFLLANSVDENNLSNKDIDEIYDKSSQESKLIFEDLKANGYLDMENNVELTELQTIDVTQLKEDLNIKNKFCIVFEKDGNLIKVDPENEINGIGDSEIIVNGVPCKFN